MVPMAFPAIRTPASCHTPLPAWLQSPLLAPSGTSRLTVTGQERDAQPTWAHVIAQGRCE
jgi:hypothetical protein